MHFNVISDFNYKRCITRARGIEKKTLYYLQCIAYERKTNSYHVYLRKIHDFDDNTHCDRNKNKFVFEPVTLVLKLHF